MDQKLRNSKAVPKRIVPTAVAERTVIPIASYKESFFVKIKNAEKINETVRVNKYNIQILSTTALILDWKLLHNKNVPMKVTTVFNNKYKNLLTILD